jgi:abortive infection bacteriophage resistance protein
MPLNDAHLVGFFHFKGVRMQFEKPPLSYPQQIALLESRGLSVPNHGEAEQYLKHISYYRLSAYALPYQSTKDVFNAGTSFSDLLNLYVFDRELRIIAFDAIERIEIAIRAQIIYQLAHKYGSHWQDDPTIFVPAFVNRAGVTVDIFADTQKVIQEHCATKRPEVFIKHYSTKYTHPPTPPSWMCIELLTIGQLSRMYSALKNNSDRNDIAQYFGLHYTLLESWFHALTYVRNICAHHSRLWNREFAIQPNMPKNNLALPWLTIKKISNSRSFYFLCILKYLLQTVNPQGHFKQRLISLIDEPSTIPIQFLGIPTVADGTMVNWQAEALWS